MWHTFAWIIGVAVALIVVSTIHLSLVLRWQDENTVGLRYYGLSADERERFKKRLRFHAALLGPIQAFYGSFGKIDFRKVRIVYKDVSLPAGSCDAASAERAGTYQARPEDIFVATQMKCGTTWMENIVYEVLHRGNGTLEDTGTTMYSIAPWLEGRRSVSLDEAPLLGTERPSRIIKTHMPAHLCPSNPASKFIYVYRHPVSCFASCVDFLSTNVGNMAPETSEYEKWFTSPELMWWGTWTAHVQGWWDRAQRDSNVLLIQFEQMNRDLPGMVKRVVEFLGVAPLTDDELARVVEKCGFAYMQRHQNLFEMQPPHVLQADAKLFVKGTADRHKDVPPDMRKRILTWAATEMKGSDFLSTGAYSDLLQS